MGTGIRLSDQVAEDLTELVMVIRYEDQVIPDTGTVVRLAKVLQDRAYGDIEVEILQVQAVGPAGLLTDCAFRVEGGDRFDEDDFAWLKVTVTFTDGHEEFAYYRIDGRS